jgi:hypothetical protein
MKLLARWAGIVAALGSAAGAAHAIEYRTYDNPQLGLSLSIPAEWETSEGKDGSLTVTGSAGVLVVSARPRGEATEETLRQYALSYVRGANVRLQNSGRKTVNGVPGWLFQYVTRDPEDPLRGDTLCLLHENWLVAVAFATREWLYAASRPVFDTAIHSLRLQTPHGMRPLTRGFRRFEDPRGNFRLQVPESWQLASSANSLPFFAGADGTLQVIVDGGSRYLAGDTEILARAYVQRASYRLQKLTPGKIDSQPGQFAYCVPNDASDWKGCFVVMVREGKLYVLKIAYQGETGEARVREIVEGFQFLPVRAADGGAAAGKESAKVP